jgi:hypothetical protein
VKSAAAVAAQPPSTSPQQLCGFASPRLCVEGSAAIGSHEGTEARRAGAAGRWTLVARRRRRQQNMLIVACGRQQCALSVSFVAL